MIDANQIEPGEDSRFPTIKRKMKQGKYNSIIIFNATSEEHPRALSEYPLCKSGQYKLHHLLDEVYGTGVSSDDLQMECLVAFIDNLILTMDYRLASQTGSGKPADISNGQFDFPFRRER